MTLDRSFVELNRASTKRIRDVAARLSDAELQHPVGEHWTVGIVFAHYVVRSLHRGEHLDEAEAALKS